MAAAIRRDGAYALSAAGEVRVVDADPLLLDVDLVLGVGDGAETTVIGTIQFRVFREAIACT